MRQRSFVRCRDEANRPLFRNIGAKTPKLEVKKNRGHRVFFSLGDSSLSRRPNETFETGSRDGKFKKKFLEYRLSRCSIDSRRRSIRFPRFCTIQRNREFFRSPTSRSCFALSSPPRKTLALTYKEIGETVTERKNDEDNAEIDRSLFAR